MFRRRDQEPNQATQEDKSGDGVRTILQVLQEQGRRMDELARHVKRLEQGLLKDQVSKIHSGFDSGSRVCG